MKEFIDSFFKISQKQSSIRTEILAGVSTFLAMSYILVVNPIILSNAGMDSGSVFTATIVSTIIATLLMGIIANYPIALAPGMGMNAFFTYSVVIGMGYTWQQALAAIFISGLCFICLSLSGIRKRIIMAIPKELKFALSAGIGFFIAFLGVKNAGLIVSNPATFVGLGDLTDPSVLLSVLGLVITLVLFIKKIPGAIFIGIVVTTIIGMITGLIAVPSSAVSSIPSIAPTFGGLFSALKDPSLYTLEFGIVVFSFLFVDFFDTAGFLVAIGDKAGLTNKDGELEGIEKALLCDSIATTTGAVLGTSSVTTFGESLVGVGVGGRTGFTSIVTAICFAIAIFFFPVVSVITASVTAPALIIVGAIMVGSFGEIDWNDTAMMFPAFATVLFTVLSFSIATGIAVGFLLYPILMIADKRAKEVDPILYILSIIFIIYFAIK